MKGSGAWRRALFHFLGNWITYPNFSATAHILFATERKLFASVHLGLHFVNDF
jgi:hypothetical protein